MDEFACGSVCNLSVSPSNIVNCLSRDSEKERKNMCVSENLDLEVFWLNIWIQLLPLTVSNHIPNHL